MIGYSMMPAAMGMRPGPMIPMYYPYISPPMPNPPISAPPATHPSQPPSRTSAGTPPASAPAAAASDAHADTNTATTDVKPPAPSHVHADMYMDPVSAAMFYGRSMPPMMGMHAMNMMMPQMHYHPYAQPPVIMQHKGTPPPLSPHRLMSAPQPYANGQQHAPAAAVPVAGSSTSSTSSELCESSSPKALKRSRPDGASGSPVVRRRSPHSGIRSEMSNSVDAASTLLLSLSAPKSPSREMNSSPSAQATAHPVSAVSAENYYKRHDDVKPYSAQQQAQLQAYTQVHAPTQARPSLAVNGSSSNKWLKASVEELETIDDIVMGNRRHRRKSGELDMEERWNCPLGCGKFYRRTSSRSIHQHMADCPLIKTKQALAGRTNGPTDAATAVIAATMASAPLTNGVMNGNSNGVHLNGKQLSEKLEALITEDFAPSPLIRQALTSASPPPTHENGKAVTPIAEGDESSDDAAMKDETSGPHNVTAKAEPTDNDEMDIPPLIPHTNGHFNGESQLAADKSSLLDASVIKCSMCNSLSSSSTAFHICPNSDCDKAYCPDCIAGILTFIHQKQHATKPNNDNVPNRYGRGSRNDNDRSLIKRRHQKPRTEQFVNLQKSGMTMSAVLIYILLQYDPQANCVEICDGADKISSAGAALISDLICRFGFNPCAVDFGKLPPAVQKVNKPRRLGMKFKLVVSHGGRRGFQQIFRKALLEHKLANRLTMQYKSSELDLSTAITEAARWKLDWSPFVKLKHGNSGPRRTALQATSSPEPQTSSIDSVGGELQYNQPPPSPLDGMIPDLDGTDATCSSYSSPELDHSDAELYTPLPSSNGLSDIIDFDPDASEYSSPCLSPCLTPQHDYSQFETEIDSKSPSSISLNVFGKNFNESSEFPTFQWPHSPSTEFLHLQCLFSSNAGNETLNDTIGSNLYAC